MKKHAPCIFAALSFAWCFLIRYAAGADFERGQSLALFVLLLPMVSLLGFVMGLIVKGDAK